MFFPNCAILQLRFHVWCEISEEKLSSVILLMLICYYNKDWALLKEVLVSIASLSLSAIVRSE